MKRFLFIIKIVNPKPGPYRVKAGIYPLEAKDCRVNNIMGFANIFDNIDPRLRKQAISFPRQITFFDKGGYSDSF